MAKNKEEFDSNRGNYILMLWNAGNPEEIRSLSRVHSGYVIVVGGQGIMTIREHLVRQRKPYIIYAIVSIVICVAGLALVFTSGWGVAAAPTEGWRFFGGIAGWILFSVGYTAWFAVIVIPVFKIKCPRCGKRLGWVFREKWNHCPFCAVSLDSQLEGMKE